MNLILIYASKSRWPLRNVKETPYKYQVINVKLYKFKALIQKPQMLQN